MCESRGGRPGPPVPNGPYGLCGRKATLNFRDQELCKSQGLCERKATTKNRVQELCESRGGRPVLPVPSSPHGLCGRKATLNSNPLHTIDVLTSIHHPLCLRTSAAEQAWPTQAADPVIWHLLKVFHTDESESEWFS